MGYRMSVADEEERQDMRTDIDNGCWSHDFGPGINAKCLRVGPLPSYYEKVMVGMMNPITPMEAEILADGLERHMTRSEVRSHSRSDQLTRLIEWLRFWAEAKVEVSSG